MPDEKELSHTELKEALNIAVSNNDRNNVKLLLEKITSNEDLKKATLGDGISLGNDSPLNIAVSNNYEDIAKLLIKAGADVDECNLFGGDERILHIAAENGHLGIVKLLIDAGADVNEVDRNEHTPLNRAVEQLILIDLDENDNEGLKNDFKEIAKLLIEKMDDKGLSTLHEATRNENIDVVKQLIGVGVDVNRVNGNNEAALHFAALNVHTEMAELLIANGADVNKVDIYGETPLHKAVAFRGPTKLVEKFIEAGADPNKTDNQGCTALNIAASKGYKELVNSLIELKADVNKADENGYTPLHKATKNRHIDVVKELLRNERVDVNKADENGYTPLYIATHNGDTNNGDTNNGDTKIVELIEARAVLDEAIKGLDRTINASGSNTESAKKINGLLVELIKNPDDEEKKSALQTLVKKELEIAKANKGKKLFPKLLHRSNFIPALEKLQRTPTEEEARELVKDIRHLITLDKLGSPGNKPLAKGTSKGAPKGRG
jgi:ankyrin repeat protein